MHHFNRQSHIYIYIYIHTLGYDVYDIVFLLDMAVLRPTVLVLGALCSVIE